MENRRMFANTKNGVILSIGYLEPVSEDFVEVNDISILNQFNSEEEEVKLSNFKVENGVLLLK